MDGGTNRINVLVVDNEKSIRHLLKRLLEADGYSCILSSNGEEAKTVLMDVAPELVLCDIQMPGESGLDLTRYILAEHQNTAVVIVTFVKDLETARALLEMGVYGYILKPFDQNQILISVANALRRREFETKQRSYQQELEKIVRQRAAEILKVNRALKRSEAALRTQKEELEEANSALRVLLKRVEEDKAALEKNMLTNIKKTVEPCLERLARKGLNAEQTEILHILESNLQEITSSFAKELSSSYLNLTPTEIQIAGLIKQGKTTKDIASLLCLSENTIMSHRFKIRRKLGLLNKKMNLRSFLHSLR